jgi:hypothetical protein
MLKLGVAVKSLGRNQLAYYAVRNCNFMIRDKMDVAPILFYEEPSKPFGVPGFGFLHTKDIWGFKGTVVSTSVSTANRVNKAAGPTRRILYLWDLEWMNGQTPFGYLMDVLEKQDKILARSNDHKTAIESVLNIKVHGVVDDFNYKQLIEAIK